MEKQNVWIHCRVLSNSSRNLLDYQEKLLTDIANHINLQIIGVTKEVSSGKNFDSFEMHSLINQIKKEKIDIVLVYSTKRISIFSDIYEEFEMLCLQHNVKIVSLDDIHIVNNSLIIR